MEEEEWKTAEKCLEKANKFFFTGPKNPSASVATISPGVNHNLNRMRRLSAELYLLILRSQKAAEGVPLLGTSRDHGSLLSVQRPPLFVLLHLCPPSVAIASTPVDMVEKRAQTREQKTIFEDVIPDGYPLDSEQYKEAPPETPPTEEWVHNCLLHIIVRKGQLEGK